MCPESGENRYNSYMAVLFARNSAEADYYKSLLEEHEIPLRMEKDALEATDNPGRGIAITVPEQRFAEAQDVIEQVIVDDDDDYDMDELDDFSQADPEDRSFGNDDDAIDFA